MKVQVPVSYFLGGAMSKRHRQLPTKPEKGLRRADVRKDRHAARVLLAADPDLAGKGSVTRRHPSADPVHPSGPVEVKASAFKHWKDRSWKRRNSERHRRNALLALWAQEGPPPIQLEPEPDPIPKAMV